MEKVNIQDLKNLYRPPKDSHKGQNGKLLLIGGSHLFHAASLWSLEVASRIVDLVHYSSVPENNELVSKIKTEFRDGIIVPRSDVEAYIKEDDCILIGPGMTRDQETEDLTNSLFKKFPDKQWVVDAGALQMMDIALIPKNAILTPHRLEFEGLWKKCQSINPKCRIENAAMEDRVKIVAEEYHSIVLAKGVTDIACAPSTDSGQAGECRLIEGGNEGMTKGGTGDVLAGLIAALACKNEPMLATLAGSFLNKKAGDELYVSVGPYFNSSDLAKQIPVVMSELLGIK